MSGAEDTVWQCQNSECAATLHAPELRHTGGPGMTFEICPHCGGPVTRVTPVVPTPVRPETDEPGPAFAAALLYPLRGWGLGALGLGTILVGLIAFGIPFLYGYVITIFVYGYICNYLFDILLTSAHGADTPPELPDWGNWWDDILRPILLMISTTVICFAPAFVYFIGYLVHCWYEGWVPDLSEPACIVGVVGLCVLSSFYYPMALLAVVMHDARRAASPRLVIPSIMHVLVPYAVVCGFMVLTGSVQVGVSLVFKGESLLAHFLGVFLNLWAGMVSMRLLGLLYRKHKGKLAWF